MENLTITELRAATLVIDNNLIASLSGNLQKFREEWVLGEGGGAWEQHSMKRHAIVPCGA